MQTLVDLTQKVSSMNYSKPETEIKVWFPADRMAKGLGTEFSIDVARLDSKGRGRVRVESDQIAVRYCQVIANSFPGYWNIDCEVRSFARHSKGGASAVRVEVPKSR